MRILRRYSIGCLILAILVAGCVPRSVPDEDIGTTEADVSPQITQTFTVQPTRISIPTVTPLIVGEAGNKPFPTATPGKQIKESYLQVKTVPTQDSQANPLNSNAPCYQATFIRNVTIADGAGFQPGDSVLKVWQIQNSGSCEWTANTILAFAHGIDFSAPPTLPLNTSVPPGGVIDISLSVKAPTRSGNYQGFWKLQNEMGVPIEMINAPNSEVALKIVVFIPEKPEPGLTFDFTSNFCAAEWSGSKGLIICPSQELIGAEGAVLRSYTPWLENNTRDNEPALLVLTSEGSNGYISATYPKYTVQEGDRFKTVIGCTRGVPKCRVNFEVNYKEQSGSVKNLLSWEEVYDGRFKTINVELDNIAGKTVEFILRVNNINDTPDNQVFWLWPRISNPTAVD